MIAIWWFALFPGAFEAHAFDTSQQYAVQVRATVQSAPPQITLSWLPDPLGVPDRYTVYRKAPGDLSWGSGSVLPGTATSFVDHNVTAGTIYEYQIAKTNSNHRYSGYGYLYCGINVPLVENRGKAILVVDGAYATDLAFELGRLEQDLISDGWTVDRHDVSRNDSVVSVKNLIRADYNDDPANVKAVFLFGHVPVPYAGAFAADFHAPGHFGAWPADVFYGEMNGDWTDSSVRSTVAEHSRNRNVPGDGKFDQSSPPSPVDLQIGRVDLSSLPAFKQSELELLRRYLDKDHAYRHKRITLPLRGLIRDSDARDGEAYPACAFRSWAPLFDANNVSVAGTGQWHPTLAAHGHWWAYGLGGGSFFSIAGLGNSGSYNEVTTWDFAATDVQVMFYMLSGSWLNDWDSENNIMRAAIATPTYGLACAGGGQPHWFFHPLGLGETLGFCARLTQNNGPTGHYRNQINDSAGQVHVALMGDPTLRMYPVAPPTGLTAAAVAGVVSLDWNVSADPVAGYFVYRASNAKGPYTRITPSMVVATNFTDATMLATTSTYMVRAIKLESTPSGTFFNASQGVFVTASVSAPTLAIVNALMSGGNLRITWVSAPGKSYRVAFKDSLTDAGWTDLSDIVTATSTTTEWTDTNMGASTERYYVVYAVN